MHISRRDILKRMTAGVVGAKILPLLSAAPTMAATEHTLQSTRHIRLDRNENAYGPSGKALAAMNAATLNLKADPEEQAETLRSALADFHRGSPDRIILGCGSTEIMRMAVNTFLGPGKALVAGRPTFDMVGSFAERAGAEVIPVPLTSNYAHDLQTMRTAASRAGLVYICNPNNPTGTLTPRREVEDFIRSLPAGVHIIIDEAYHEYVPQSADYVSFADRPSDDERVIVLRTFSKVYGLAGLRIGYGVAAPKTIRLLGSGLPGDMNILAAGAAIAALADRDHVSTSVQRNADDRQEFLNQANARMVRAIDSQANFVMLNTARSAVEVVEHFKKNQIALPAAFPLFDQHIRVSLGTTSDMAEFWRVWDLMPQKMIM